MTTSGQSTPEQRPPLAVFWDVDGTLVCGSMESHFVRWLRQNGRTGIASILLSAAAIALAKKQCHWHLMKLSFLRGYRVTDVREWIDKCWQTEIEPALCHGPVKVVKRLRSDGIRQVLLTGGPRPLAERMATHLGLDDIIAAEPEVIEGSYSGSLIAPHPIRWRKLAAAERWLVKNDLDWNRTAAVADHYDDRFLLDKVGKAIVANPGRRMTRYSRDRGWPVLQSDDDFSSLPELLGRE